MAPSPDEQDGFAMSVSHWEKVKEVLYQAMQLGPEQREAFVEHACAPDEGLRNEVRSLLQAQDAIRPDFLQSAAGGGSPGEDTRTGILQPDHVFSQRFALVRKLGEGGMGQVWLCEQTNPVQRQVALKLIKAGLYDEAVLRRFQSERQSLAIMEHPAIAKIYEAGTTPEGQPYFVMEYVPGLPITEYCDQKRLGITQRLELFIQACEGVQHAHQKAIIHRDLKPANILVTEVDGKPTPRIIDFGLAKPAVTADGQSLFTQPGFFIGTPAYMSPEQADPNVSDVDTRTDVYSLGVILYVLLAGSQPFETNRQKPPVHELLRRLREEEPPRPSTKISSDHETSTSAAEARGTDPRQLAGQLRGDLDWITLKAMEKDRDRRYGTPSELADDLRRHLNHELVLARPASAGHRMQKYVRRHRIAVSAVAGLLILLAAFAAVQTVQLRRITAERDRANRERDRATRITDFMTSIFKVSDPSEARGNSVTAREILDKAANDLSGLARDPEVQTQMMRVMARTYANLGLYGRAHQLAEKALDERLKLFGPEDADTLESMSQLGGIVMREGSDYAGAEKLERDAFDRESRVLGLEDPRTLDTMDLLAIAADYQGRCEQEEKIERQVVDIRSRIMGPENPKTQLSMTNLADAFWCEGRYADAENEDRKLVEIALRTTGPDAPHTLGVMINLADSIKQQGRFSESEGMLRQIIATEERVLGPQHPETVAAVGNLAEVLGDEGRLAESQKLYQQALSVTTRTLGPEHPTALHYQSNIGESLFKQGHLAEAEKLQNATLITQLRVLGPDNPDTLATQSAFARTLTKEGHYEEAERAAQKSYEVQLQALGPDHPDTLAALQLVGTALAYEHRYPEAAKLFHDVIENQGKAGGKDDFHVWYSFACVAAAANHPEEAIRYLREAVHRGYTDRNRLVTDDDLRRLHANSDFQTLAASLNRTSATTQGK
jgi:eukaryotic-like serine/threonine-protein kinase